MKKPKDENEEQSARFLKVAHDLEAAGELSPIDAQRGLDQILKRPTKDDPPLDE